jgi:hypothetical protein
MSRSRFLQVPAGRLLEETIAATFLRLFLVALALLPLPFGICLLHYLARFALFVNALEPLVVDQATGALATISVFAKTCRGGRSGSAFRATLETVVQVAWVRHD